MILEVRDLDLPDGHIPLALKSRELRHLARGAAQLDGVLRHRLDLGRRDLALQRAGSVAHDDVADLP